MYYLSMYYYKLFDPVREALQPKSTLFGLNRDIILQVCRIIPQHNPIPPEMPIIEHLPLNLAILFIYLFKLYCKAFKR